MTAGHALSGMRECTPKCSVQQACNAGLGPRSGHRLDFRMSATKHLPRLVTGAKSQCMNAPQKPSPQSPAPSEEGRPATLGQKIFLVVLCLYVLSLVWLTLSHHWYGVLPKWLDPH